MSVAVLPMSPSTLPARLMKWPHIFIRLSTCQQQQQQNVCYGWDQVQQRLAVHEKQQQVAAAAGTMSLHAHCVASPTHEQVIRS
jgi:hypothetical protein